MYSKWGWTSSYDYSIESFTVELDISAGIMCLSAMEHDNLLLGTSSGDILVVNLLKRCVLSSQRLETAYIYSTVVCGKDLFVGGAKGSLTKCKFSDVGGITVLAKTTFTFHAADQVQVHLAQQCIVVLVADRVLRCDWQTLNILSEVSTTCPLDTPLRSASDGRRVIFRNPSNEICIYDSVSNGLRCYPLDGEMRSLFGIAVNGDLAAIHPLRIFRIEDSGLRVLLRPTSIPQLARDCRHIQFVSSDVLVGVSWSTVTFLHHPTQWTNSYEVLVPPATRPLVRLHFAYH